MPFDDDLFDRIYPRLVRYGIRLTGDRDEAEDVAQEAFVRMVQHQVSGTEDGLRVWLFRTALNLVRDRARVRSNRERILEAHPPDPPRPDTPEEVAERRGAVARARTALEALDARDREILLGQSKPA